MTTWAKAFREELGTFLWRVWAALGVSSWEPTCHSRWVIDPEPLILLTSTYATADSRLRDETLAWCLRHGGSISVTRLANLVKAGPWSKEAALAGPWARYAATVEAGSRIRWLRTTSPGGAAAGTPYPFARPGASGVQPFEGCPAHLHLRLRALFGTSARADVLAMLLATQRRTWTATELVDRGIGYTRRGVVDVLDDLVRAGAMRPYRSGSGKAYELDRKLIEGLSGLLLGSAACSAVAWVFVGRVLGCLLAFADQGASEAVGDSFARSLTARRLAEALADDVRRAGLDPLPLGLRGDAFLPALERWALDAVRALAVGEAPGQGAPAGSRPVRARSRP